MPTYSTSSLPYSTASIVELTPLLLISRLNGKSLIRRQSKLIRTSHGFLCVHVHHGMALPIVGSLRTHPITLLAKPITEETQTRHYLRIETLRLAHMLFSLPAGLMQAIPFSSGMLDPLGSRCVAITRCFKAARMRLNGPKLCAMGRWT